MLFAQSTYSKRLVIQKLIAIYGRAFIWGEIKACVPSYYALKQIGQEGMIGSLAIICKSVFRNLSLIRRSTSQQCQEFVGIKHKPPYPITLSGKFVLTEWVLKGAY